MGIFATRFTYPTARDHRAGGVKPMLLPI